MRRSALICLVLAAIPALVLALVFFGPYLTDTALIYSNLSLDVGSASLEGRPNIEPNIGNISFSLGALAAAEIAHGTLPLWNHYSGLGEPLLGAMQPAALFPPTLLLLLPHGQAIEHALLQLIAGVGAYLFFRRFGLATLPALAGAMLFEVNGVFAWLRNAIFNPVAFLPWLMFALEGMLQAAREKQPFIERFSTVCLGAVAAALALYAGFPEQVYLYLIFLAAWAIFRMVGCTRGQLGRLAADGVLTAVLALALAAPVLTAFAGYLPEANLATHAGQAFYGQWMPPRQIVQNFLPYVFGPIWTSYMPLILSVWGGTGGYIGTLPVLIAFASLLTPRRRATKLFLFAWIVVGWGVTYGWAPIYYPFMQLPLAKTAACFRYITISWIFATIFLCALFLDDLLSGVRTSRAVVAGAIVTATCIAFAIPPARELLDSLWAISRSLKHDAIAAVAIAGFLTAAAIGASFLAARRAAIAVAAILVFEATTWFFIPFLSYPRRGRVDLEAITFLQRNIGHQRLLITHGERGYGLLPNYPAAYRIPALNYANVPTPMQTAVYLREKMDQYASELLLPWEPGLPADKQAERDQLLKDRLPAYAKAGVKYVMAGPHFDDRLNKVYEDPLVSIYELPDTRPYVSAPDCKLKPSSFDRVEVDCAQPSLLTRLELHMNGWTAAINGIPVPITLEDNTFEQVTLPSGHSTIVFTYSPPGFGASAIVFFLTTLVMLFGCTYRFVVRSAPSLQSA